MIDVSFPDWDKELLVLLNSKHTPWLDPVMYALSTYTSWILIFIAVCVYIIYKNRKAGVRAAFFLFLGIAINSVVNNLIKLVIMRPRPGHDESIQEFIRQLEDVGRTSSFFSAHSSNSFCLALFTTLYFRNKYYGIVAFVWAIAVAYSRIYVGKHYPLDVMCGILFGLMTGSFTYWLYKNKTNSKML